MNDVAKFAKDVDGQGLRMLIAAGIWGLGVFLTWSAFVSAGLPADTNTDAGQWVIVTAFAMQGALTAIEMRVWRGGGNAVSLAVLGIDVLINWAGTVQYTAPLSAYLFANVGGWGFINISNLLGWAFPIMIAFLIAYTPEQLWNEGRGKR